MQMPEEESENDFRLESTIMKEEPIVQSTLNVSLKVFLYNFQNQAPTNQSSYVMLALINISALFLILLLY